MAQYLLFLIASPIAARMPRGILTFLGALAGAVSYVAARPARQAVHRNLAVVMPDKPERQRRTAAVGAFMHAAWSYIEILRLEHTTVNDIRTGYPLSGWERVDQAVAQGHGIVMLSAHVGAFSSAGQVIALSGVPTTVLVEEVRPLALHKLLSRLREKFGLRMLVADRAAIRHIMSALRKNECVGMMCDRDVVGTGEWLPFFGRDTRMTTAAATIAIRTGAVVLPVVGYRTGLLTGPAIVDEPVEMPHTGNVAEDVREGTLRIISRLEAFIREHPEQWVVFEDIWPYGTIPRTRPDRAS